MPAFATSRSTARSSSIHRSTSSRLETSPTSPVPPISAATASTCSRVRPATATRIPADARSRAMPAPIPRPPPVTRARPSSRSDDTRYLLQRLWVLHRRQVTGVLPEGASPHRPPDDLRAARFRERGDEQDPIRPERLSELRGHALADLRRERVARLDAVARHAEDPGDLALHVVRHPHRGRLRDGRVRHDRRLELCRADPLAGDVERVVRAPVQEPVPVLVHGGPVPMRPDTREPA